MSAPYAERLISFPLFYGFTIHGAERLLGDGAIKQHLAGETLFKEGDQATCVLLVLGGKLEVFVEREGRSLVLTETEPGTILGELAVLCGIPRSASVRAKEDSVVLEWDDDAFRTLLLRDPSLSQRIFREALRTLIDKERSLIDSLIKPQSAAG